MNKSHLPPDAAPTHANPKQLLDDDSLTTSQKLNGLQDWRLDLLERQKATEENMPSSDDQSGEVAEELRRVNDALRIINEN